MRASCTLTLLRTLSWTKQTAKSVNQTCNTKNETCATDCLFANTWLSNVNKSGPLFFFFLSLPVHNLMHTTCRYNTHGHQSYKGARTLGSVRVCPLCYFGLFYTCCFFFLSFGGGGGGGDGFQSVCVFVCVRARVFRWCSLWFLVCLGWLSLLFFLFQGQKSSLYIMNVRSHEMDFIINILSIPVSMFIFHVSIFVLHVSKRLAAQVTHEVFLPCVFGITVVAECLEWVEHLKTHYAQVLLVKLACVQAQLFLCHKHLTAQTAREQINRTLILAWQLLLFKSGQQSSLVMGYVCWLGVKAGISAGQVSRTGHVFNLSECFKLHWAFHPGYNVLSIASQPCKYRQEHSESLKVSESTRLLRQ